MTRDIPPPSRTTLRDLPLWRLIVALDDAERTAGPSSGTARVLARALRARLAEGRTPAPPAREEEEEEAGHA
jgi:hypothetical protein